MPGYSGTPLPKKLGIKDGFRVSAPDMPRDVEEELRDALKSCTIDHSCKRSVDFMMYFASSKKDLEDFEFASRQLTPAGMLWACWPKKTSGVATDLNENIVREIGLAAGLVDVKVCAVTDVWSGLKFVRRLKDRK